MDAARLGLLALISIAVHSWLIARTEVPARDAVGFVRTAAHLESPPGDLTRIDLIRASQHPPGYPAVVWAVSASYRGVTGEGITTHNMMLCAQLAAALAALITVFPMYLLGRRLFGPGVALLAAGMFQILPVYAQISSDGLADSLFLLLAITSLYFGVRGFGDGRWPDFAMCGLFSGAAYLVRPEGLLVGAVAGCMLLGIWVRASWRVRRVAARCGALAIGLLLTAGPYMVLIGGVTNKPTGDVLLDQIRGKETQQTWQGAPEAKRVGSAPLFAAWWHEPTDAGQTRLVWAGRQLGDESLKSFHYLPALWAAVGIVLLSSRWRRDPALAFPLVLMLAHLGLLWALAAKIGYVSERHTLLIVACGCLFAAAAVPPMGRWVASWALYRRGDARFWMGTLILTLAAICLPVIARSELHANRAGHRQAGEWLATNAEPNAVIYDPFCWAQFYAGRSWVVEPFPTAGTDPVYIVLEPNNGNPHSRLPMMRQAQVMAMAGKPVYHWPESSPLGEADVVIYRAVPPGDDAPAGP